MRSKKPQTNVLIFFFPQKSPLRTCGQKNSPCCQQKIDYPCPLSRKILEHTHKYLKKAGFRIPTNEKPDRFCASQLKDQTCSGKESDWLVFCAKRVLIGCLVFDPHSATRVKHFYCLTKLCVRTHWKFTQGNALNLIFFASGIFCENSFAFCHSGLIFAGF